MRRQGEIKLMTILLQPDEHSNHATCRLRCTAHVDSFASPETELSACRLQLAGSGDTEDDLRPTPLGFLNVNITPHRLDQLPDQMQTQAMTIDLARIT